MSQNHLCQSHFFITLNGIEVPIIKCKINHLYYVSVIVTPESYPLVKEQFMLANREIPLMNQKDHGYLPWSWFELTAETAFANSVWTDYNFQLETYLVERPLYLIDFRSLDQSNILIDPKLYHQIVNKYPFIDGVIRQFQFIEIGLKNPRNCLKPVIEVISPITLDLENFPLENLEILVTE